MWIPLNDVIDDLQLNSSMNLTSLSNKIEIQIPSNSVNMNESQPNKKINLKNN